MPNFDDAHELLRRLEADRARDVGNEKIRANNAERRVKMLEDLVVEMTLASGLYRDRSPLYKDHPRWVFPGTSKSWNLALSEVQADLLEEVLTTE